jgi:hypothetical protein
VQVVPPKVVVSDALCALCEPCSCRDGIRPESPKVECAKLQCPKLGELRQYNEQDHSLHQKKKKKPSLLPTTMSDCSTDAHTDSSSSPQDQSPIANPLQKVVMSEPAEKVVTVSWTSIDLAYL